MWDWLILARLVAWKLADNTFLYNDLEGLRELAWPGAYPGGVLNVAARLLMLTGLSDAWWWAPYLAGGIAIGLLARAAFRLPARLSLAFGLAWALFPLFSTNDFAWTTPWPAFPMVRILGACVTLGGFICARPFLRRSKWAILPVALVCAAGHIPFGAYALAAGALCLVCHVWRQREGFIALVLAVCVLLAAHPLACRAVYGDTEVYFAWLHAHGEGTTFDFRASAVPALQLERLVRAGDWKGVMAVEERARAAGRDYPLRMEISWRLLAQARLGRLPEDLFAFPIRTYHGTSDADQRMQDGYELYYRFGFLLPARREIMERMCGTFLLPHAILRMGDIAYLQGNVPLAQKYYRYLARYVGYGEQAAARLAMLEGQVPVPPDLACDRDWAAVVGQNFGTSADRIFFEASKRFESFVHRCVRRMRAVPEPFVRLRLAGLLLEGDVPAILDEAEILDALYPAPKPWPRPVQEAVLAFAEAEGGKNRALLAQLRPGAIEPETAARFVRFREATANRRPVNDEATERIRRLFGGTFWFYEWWVLRAEKGPAS